MSVSLKIEKYSHGCRVTGFDVDALHKTTRFLETLSLKEPQRVQNRMQMVLKKKYYGMTENRRELFIHRNTLTDYVNHMSCLLYTSPSPRDLSTSRMPSSA